MELGFVGGGACVVRRDRRALVPVRGRRHARTAVVALGGGKGKIEVPDAKEMNQAEVNTVVEVPTQSAPQDSGPFWKGLPVGKIFFAVSIASFGYTLVKNTVFGGSKKSSTSRTGVTSRVTAPPARGAAASGSIFSKPAAGSPAAGSAAAPRAAGWASPTKAVPTMHQFDSQAKDLLEDREKKYILVGGKGGVGKTSMSAALATKFADSSQTTLIISTDPAHSLSDAFGSDLSGGMPVPVLGIENLYAQEINPNDIKSQINLLSPEEKRSMMPGMAGEMGLDELDGLFDTLPPGFDEAVALVEIIKLIQGDASYMKFDRIVFDTAPTGHTLRLLALPDFMDSFLGKIISMKAKFGNMMGQMKSMFGGDGADGLDTRDIDDMKKSMQVVKDLFKDKRQTEFVVATIPNMMAISESTRLIDELRKEDIPVHYVFVNQIQPQNDDCAFCSTRRKEQQANLMYVERTFDNMKLSKIQFFDREIRGPYALRTMGRQIFQTEEEAAAEAKAAKAAAKAAKEAAEAKAAAADAEAKAALAEANAALAELASSNATPMPADGNGAASSGTSTETGKVSSMSDA